MLYFLLEIEYCPLKDNFLEKTLSKNLFRITAIVLLFLTGALVVNYQCKYFFPQFALNVLYLQLYTFAFVVLFLFLNKKAGKIKITIRQQIILLATCLVYFLICPGVITGLQNDLLTAQQFQGYFNAFLINAVFVGIIFYKLINIERTAKAIVLLNPDLFVWLICAGIVIFLSFESFWVVNKIFYNSGNSLNEIQKVFIKTFLPILWGICSFCFMWLGMKYKFKPLRIISLVLFLITLLKLFIFDISNIPVAGKIAAFFCLGVLLLIVSFMYERVKNSIINDEKNKRL